MVDIHSHILPGIDDGSSDIEETITMVKEAYKSGFTKIISTSHYYLRHYEVNESIRIECINEINNRLKEIGCDMQVFPGSEIYFTNDIINLLADHEASSMNSSRYVLFETSFIEQPDNFIDVVYSLLSNNYIPILAHPERYKYVQKDPNILLELLELGVLLQSNYGSIIGQYEKEAQKTVKLLLKNNFIHFLGSDAHRKDTTYPYIPRVIEELEDIISERKIEELTEINPNSILQNEEIETRTPTKIKKGLFGF